MLIPRKQHTYLYWLGMDKITDTHMLRLKQLIAISVALILFTFSSNALCKTFKDSLGRNIILKKEPLRIISLAASLTEILYYLGLEDRVVGVTQFSYYPPEAKLKPKVGTYIDLNVEKILSLSPDLIIGTVDGNSPSVIELLEHAGIPVFIVNPRDITQAIETIHIIGDLCGIPEKARGLTSGLNQRVDRVKKLIEGKERPLVFLQINLVPIMSVNQNTFHHDLISLAGGINMTMDEPITYPRINIEEVIVRKPDVMIISSMEIGGRFEAAKQDWKKWKSIPAVQNNRVHLIDSDLIDRPSPRSVDGLEELARIIHPELNWE